MTEPRTGFSRRSDIPSELLAQLNAGTAESATLAETLAIDFCLLAQAAVPDLPTPTILQIQELADRGITRRMQAVGAILLGHLGEERLPLLLAHHSDTVRGWACYAIGLTPKLNLKTHLERIQPLADDHHFGVREWAWMSVRPHLANNLGHAITRLQSWVNHDSANIRRFATESLRPRGVWCSHIEALKAKPELALPLLEPLKSDSSKYVQDSVGNWLNDAGKSQATWVHQLCKRWMAESPTLETARICNHATRNLRR